MHECAENFVKGRHPMPDHVEKERSSCLLGKVRTCQDLMPTFIQKAD
jgi:hypothetical protein